MFFNSKFRVAAFNNMEQDTEHFPVQHPTRNCENATGAELCFCVVSLSGRRRRIESEIKTDEQSKEREREIEGDVMRIKKRRKA